MKKYLFAYFATLLAFFAFSFFPVGRLWGLSHWAYLPLTLRISLLAIGVILPLLIWRFTRNDSAENADSGRKYLLLAWVVGAGLIASFYFLRAETFFNGDGYALLSVIATRNPLAMKFRNFGSALFHVSLFDLIQGKTEAQALLVFRYVSIVSGVAIVGLCAWLSRRMFDRAVERSLVFMGLISGGYMLQYFGYVEYYALFVLSVVAYSVSGVMMLKGRASRWTVLIWQCLAIFFHIFGVVLIPATTFILARETRSFQKFLSLSRKTKTVVLGTLALILIAAFAYKWYSDLFFQFAFVPLLPGRLTMDGYTLLSVDHLLDCFGLWVTVFPGVALIGLLLASRKVRQGFVRTPESRWLFGVMALTIAAGFIFDPKMGMPRDWDLFAFSMIPITVWFYVTVLSTKALRKDAARIALLSISLGLLTLIPRAQSIADPDAAIPRFRDYIELDKNKSRNSWIHLVNY